MLCILEEVFKRQLRRTSSWKAVRKSSEVLSLLLKGYSGVSLIHGLNHCETVLDSLSRDQVSRPLIYRVLSTSETTARQQYTAVNGSKYKPPLKSHK